MTDINVVVLEGRLTRDMDQLKYTPGGMAIGNFSIAVNKSQKQEQGYIDYASFFDVTVFGKTAENLRQYLVKGKQITVKGSLQQDRWEKDGQKFSRVKINAEQIQLGGSVNSNTSSTSQSAYSAPTDDRGFPEDIPF